MTILQVIGSQLSVLSFAFLLIGVLRQDAPRWMAYSWAPMFTIATALMAAGAG